MKKSKRKSKNKDRVFLSPTGYAFVLSYAGLKWYMLGKNPNSRVPYVLAHSTNKTSLVSYVKRVLGFKELEKV